jgi:opacity protein-like surface antigen
MFYKSLVLTLTSSLLTAAFALVSINGAAAEEKKNYVGATLGLPGGGTLIGVNGKFGVADSISARPFAQFLSSGGATLSVYGVSGTYDFKIPQSDLTPYAGIGVAGASVSGLGYTYSGGSGVYIEAGADYNFSDSFVANANYKFNSLGYLSLGAGYRF